MSNSVLKGYNYYSNYFEPNYGPQIWQLSKPNDCAVIGRSNLLPFVKISEVDAVAKVNGSCTQAKKNVELIGLSVIIDRSLFCDNNVWDIGVWDTGICDYWLHRVISFKFFVQWTMKCVSFWIVFLGILCVVQCFVLERSRQCSKYAFGAFFAEITLPVSVPYLWLILQLFRDVYHFFKMYLLSWKWLKENNHRGRPAMLPCLKPENMGLIRGVGRWNAHSDNGVVRSRQSNRITFLFLSADLHSFLATPQVRGQFPAEWRTRRDLALQSQPMDSE